MRWQVRSSRTSYKELGTVSYALTTDGASQIAPSLSLLRRSLSPTPRPMLHVDATLKMPSVPRYEVVVADSADTWLDSLCDGDRERGSAGWGIRVAECGAHDEGQMGRQGVHQRTSGQIDGGRKAVLCARLRCTAQPHAESHLGQRRPAGAVKGRLWRAG